ncbi:ABC transporter substrate-binding protein [Parapusillimonas sp. SGNA-6]|nr:ABC transporter substrate-binding protein [Parapusillimonas sp. SGNA-6]
MTHIHVLSGGAAQGLVKQLEDAFREESGYAIAGRFGAVGLMKEHLLNGEPCDVLILSQKLIDELLESGHAVQGTATPLGVVKTGVAVKVGEAAPQVDTPNGLKSALLQATAIYFPDPHKATAGIHFMNVLKKLGIDAEVEARLRPFPNGATAMREMAQATERGVIGCTQVSEILFTPGVRLVAPLPAEFALATTYTAAIASKAAEPVYAARLIDYLSRPEAEAARRAAGLEQA